MHQLVTLRAFAFMCFNCYCYARLLRDNANVTDQIFRKYNAIFQFGDSLADTGNLFHGQKDDHGAAKLPYGETYFGHPTGRSCDGRLVIDFIAQGLGLPLVPPYLPHKNEDFKQGVNFAVAGGTALDAAFFEKENISIKTNYSLGVQLDWFKQVLSSPSPSSRDRMLNDSLFLMGEIGGNDINDGFFQRKSVEEIRSIVPKVISAISSAITKLINEGALTLVVPGNLPIGCSPSYLTAFLSKNKDDYDPSGCLKWLNEFAEFQNKLLQEELSKLRRTHPHTNIIYGDYYNAAMEMFRFPDKFGFKGGTVLKSCCGGGGPYNYNITAMCAEEGSNVCEDPSKYVNWDGIHLTEAAYKRISNQILSTIVSNTDNHLV